MIRLPDVASPGRIGFETRRPVERRLFLDALDYLDEKDFWTSEGVLPQPDAKPTFLEVQLGQQYRVLQLPNFFAADAALFRLVQEAGLLEADCDEAADAVDYGWLVDDPWRVPVENP